MIDLHTHTLLSDGELLPSELVRRAEVLGYRVIALTDHMDSSNMETVIAAAVKAARDLNRYGRVRVIPGVEITHVPLEMFAPLVKEARSLGARLIVAHGETIVEPVMEGTNRRAIEAGVDILAHPGMIDEEDVILARQRGVTLEISARKGHSLSNGHTAKMALRHGAPLTVNTDAHSPSDLITQDRAALILRAAGIDADKVGDIFKHAEYLAARSLL